MDFAIFYSMALLKSSLGKSRNGMTMIEVLIASFIMVVICLALFNTVAYAQRSLTVHEHRMTSLHLVRQQLEILRTKAYSAPELGVKSYKLLNLPAPFSGKYTVTEPMLDQLKSIKMTIEWQEQWGAAFTTEIETHLSKALHP